MSLINDIKRDREAGTPGPWRVVDSNSIGDRCTHYYQEVWNDETDILVTTEVTRAHNDGGRVNVRRIARVPDMEAALLAAEELYRATNFLTDNDPDDVVCDGGGTAILVGLSGIRHALDAYRKATGDTQ